MIESIVKNGRSSKSAYPFCILIPAWNNLEYLKLCIGSILKNSHFENQLVIIVNEGNDGTLEWVMQQQEVDYVHARQNIGICYGLNIARSLIKSEYVVYVNDDMYLLPDWDLALDREIKSIGHKNFMLSCTMIEPVDTGNSCVVVRDFGRDIRSFDEAALLKEYQGLATSDWNGSAWPPNVVHLDLWDLVGGLSIEFSPGMYSDPDFARKLWETGVRYFKGKGNSLVYHFGSKSTNRIKKNKGRKTFMLKWGISSRTFTQKYLKMGQKFTGYFSTPDTGKLELDSLKNKIKRVKSAW
ncbi:MAG: glycosyltransferase [Bacteroidetes bacterium]|nr:glycosyltransferase [Bacteroidota bacterium]